MNFLKKKSSPAVFQREMYLPKKTLRKRDRANQENAKRQGWRTVLVVILWLLFVSVTIYMLFFSDLFRITTISFQGEGVITQKALQEALDQERSGQWFSVLRRDNILFFPSTRVERLLLSEFPLLAEVSVERRFPGSLYIRVHEKPYQLLGCSNDTCFLLDHNGRTQSLEAFLKRPDEQGQVYTLRDLRGEAIQPGEMFVTPSMIQFTNDVLDSFEHATGLSFETTLEMSSPFANELRLKTRAGYMVYLSSEVPLNQSYTTLNTFFSSEVYKAVSGVLRYIDVRVPQRIYYTRVDTAPEDTAPKDEEQSSDEGTTPQMTEY